MLDAWRRFTELHADAFDNHLPIIADLQPAERRALPWSHLPWPEKAVAAFRDAQLLTVGDVVAAGPRFFLDRKGCGRVTLVLVQMVLEAAGEELGVA